MHTVLLVGKVSITFIILPGMLMYLGTGHTNAQFHNLHKGLATQGHAQS